jgi:uroporphyrinogen-III synthase
MSRPAEQTPVLLLKTKSNPTDAYEDLFRTPRDGFDFEPTFVPVLQHQFEGHGMQQVGQLLEEQKIGTSPLAKYGGLVFTSQRAVAAFDELVKNGQATKGDEWPHLQHVPVYSVGPATTRALRAIVQTPPLQIFGEDTGNGDALAQFILEHYGQWYADKLTKPPLLFLVGEQRRDVIPKTLMDPSLPAGKRIEVDEVVVYGTGVMESFAEDFEKLLEQTSGKSMRWVVVFSPTGCETMLKGLGWLNDSTGKPTEVPKRRTTYIATIGPTTRDHLVKKFGLEPDVCAKKPSPEGVWEGVTDFINSR